MATIIESFRIKAEDILIDLLTDSGTGAMSVGPRSVARGSRVVEQASARGADVVPQSPPAVLGRAGAGIPVASRVATQ